MSFSDFTKSLLVGALLVAFVAAGAFLADPADAKRYKENYRYQDDYQRVRVVSRFSPNKSVVVAVRRARTGGREVQLPNGRWTHCSGHCGWTVQKEYLDSARFFNEPFGPGYVGFGFDFD